MSLTGLGFVALFFAGCLLALARHPIYGLVTYIAVFYLHPPSRWWGEALPDLRWSLLAAIATLAAVIIHRNKTSSLPLFRHGIVLGLLFFLVWIGLQTPWALEFDLHLEFVVLYAKYLLLVGLIYTCIESAAHLRVMLWAHVLGCLYLGFIVLDQYLGGRFEGFGGPDINDANSGAMQIVTGIVAAAALMLAGSKREKILLFLCVPLIVNALVATQSRSGFLALVTAGLVFNLLAPKKFAKQVRLLSALALVLLILVTNPVFWSRIGTIAHFGERVEGVDTGTSRLAIIEAQWSMFTTHPMGCGHRCTATLSRQYLDAEYLYGQGEDAARSSHNTFMTMLLEQGIFGAVFYVLAAIWVGRKIAALRRSLSRRDDILTSLFPAVAASLVAVFVGDMFVDYLKLEVRFWLLAIVIVMIKLNAADDLPRASDVASTPWKARLGVRRRPAPERVERRTH